MNASTREGAVALAMTGASGAQYGLTLLERLLGAGQQVHLMLSKPALIVISSETDERVPGRASEIERYFRPEFINRLDDIIVFRPLSRDNLVAIVEYELKKVRQRLAERKITLELEDKAKDFLIEKGYNPDFGARPLRRAIEHFVEDPLSEAILRGEIREGQAARVVRPEGEKVEALKIIASGVATDTAGEKTDLAKAGAEST